jgi:hypothetical protein
MCIVATKQCIFNNYRPHLTAVFTFGGSGPALTAYCSLNLKQEIQFKNRISHLVNRKHTLTF